MQIKKAVIPIAGLGTRFLPLSKIVPKEFWPLSDKPILQYIVEEAVASGIKEIIFINQPEKKSVLKYFKTDDKNLIKLLRKRGRKNLAEELQRLEKLFRNVLFKQVFQNKPLGDGHALLQSKSFVEKEIFAVAWADDVIESKTPCLSQLIKVFNKYKKPIIALSRVPRESFPSYGMIEGEKIGKKTYKIKKIVEKPSIKDSPSDLACIGRYILTPKVFGFLKKAKYNKKGEIILNEVFSEKIKIGEEILGFEIEGKWLECGNKLAYLKSNFYLSLKHPIFGKELKKFLKEKLAYF